MQLLSGQKTNTEIKIMMKKYLFILCPPGSGSTVLWKLLKTSPAISALPHEGQYLDFMTDELRRKLWDSDKDFPWLKIKEEWDKVWSSEKPILLEKSPPNLRHALEIEKIFDPAFFIVMVRNPYAFCEGSKRRKRGIFSKSYKLAAERWISDSTYQIKNIEGLKRCIFFTYEQLTEKPGQIVEKILEFLPELETLDIAAIGRVHSIHGAVARPIENLNVSQLAQLSMDDIQEINNALRLHPDIMSFFNYEYLEQSYSSIRRLRFKLSGLYIQYFIRNYQNYRHKMKQLRGMISKRDSRA